MTKIENMFRKLENLNFVIVSDFEFRASNFKFSHLNTVDGVWCDFHKLLLGHDTR